MVMERRKTDVDLSVELFGRRLETPLMPASGTLSKEAVEEVRGIYGAILPKTTTPRRRDGNPTPRIAETPAGMVNSIGLQNPGVEAFMKNLDDFDLGVPIFVSVAGNTVDEFRSLCEVVSADERVFAIEMNLSCPNVEHGGLTFCAGPDSVEEVVSACRKVSEKPLSVKLTFEGAVENAVAAEASGADALTVMNTIPALTVDAGERKVLVKGGLSGPAIKPVAMKAVYDVSGAVEIPIIASGGVSTGVDIAEFMMAGATVAQIGTASFVRDPEEMLGEFEGCLRRHGVSASALIGCLRGNLPTDRG